MDDDRTPLAPHPYLFSSSLNGDPLRDAFVKHYGLDLLEPQSFSTWDHPDVLGRLWQLWTGKDEHALFENQIAVEVVVEKGTCYTGKRMLLYNPEGSENNLCAILLDAGYGFDSTATAVSKDNYTNPGFVFTDRVADIVCWRLIEKAHQSDPNDMLNSRFGRLMYALGDQKYQQPEGAVLDDNNDGVEAEGSDGADGARTPPPRAPLALGVKPPPGAGRHGGAHYAETTEPLKCFQLPEKTDGHINCMLLAGHEGDHAMVAGSRSGGDALPLIKVPRAGKSPPAPGPRAREQADSSGTDATTSVAEAMVSLSDDEAGHAIVMADPLRTTSAAATAMVSFSDDDVMGVNVQQEGCHAAVSAVPTAGGEEPAELAKRTDIELQAINLAQAELREREVKIIEERADARQRESLKRDRESLKRDRESFERDRESFERAFERDRESFERDRDAHAEQVAQLFAEKLFFSAEKLKVQKKSDQVAIAVKAMRAATDMSLPSEE